MIVYFDSSSIVKWFFDEPFADLARNVKNASNIALTSLLSYPEVISAIRRAWRDGRCNDSEMAVTRDEFQRVWPQLKWIGVNEALVQQAGQLIFKHNLRGFDAVHLASALLLKEESDEVDVFFSCFDTDLNRAAQIEGFMIHAAL